MKEEFPRDQDGEIIPFEEWSRDVDREFGAEMKNYFDAFVVGFAFVFLTAIACCCN